SGLLLPNHLVDRNLRQLGKSESEESGNDGARNGPEGHPWIRAHIDGDPPDDFPGRAGPGRKRRVVLVGGTVVMVRHGENYVGISAELCLAVPSLLESIMQGNLAHPASKQKSKVPCP